MAHAALVAACAPSQAPEPPPAPEPVLDLTRRVGSMSELMVDILYPAGDAVFYIETRTPTNSEEWALLQAQTLMIAEAAWA